MEQSELLFIIRFVVLFEGVDSGIGCLLLEVKILDLFGEVVGDEGFNAVNFEEKLIYQFCMLHYFVDEIIGCFIVYLVDETI